MYFKSSLICQTTNQKLSTAVVIKLVWLLEDQNHEGNRFNHYG